MSNNCRKRQTAEEVVMKLANGKTEVSFWLTKRQTAWLFDVWQRNHSRQLQKLGYGGYPSNINGGVDGEWSFEAVKSHLNGCALLTVKPVAVELEPEESYIDRYCQSRYQMSFMDIITIYGDVAVAQILKSDDFLIATGQKKWDGGEYKPVALHEVIERINQRW